MPTGLRVSYLTAKFPKSGVAGASPAWSCPTLRDAPANSRGESVEIPWDFARHYCDATYRPTVEAIAALGRRTIGERVRRYRESAGLTQEALARAAEIGRVTLVRLENGEQSPRFKTLKAVAGALGMEAPELLVEPELLRR